MHHQSTVSGDPIDQWSMNIDTKFFSSSGDLDLGIGTGALSWIFWVERQASTGSALFDHVLAAATNANRIRIFHRDDGGGGSGLGIQVYDSSAVLRLDAEWDTADYDETDEWDMISVTWDGSTNTYPLVRINDAAYVIDSGDSSKAASTRTDTGRQTFIGPQGSTLLFRAAMWSEVLDADSITALYDGGAGWANDIRADFDPGAGDYTQSDTLIQNWELGRLAGSLGKSRVASGGIDLNSGDITTSERSIETPS